MLSLLPRHSDWEYCFAHSPSPISLPRTGGQVGLCNVVFEDCSAFTHVTACTLAKSLNDPLHQRLQPLRYLHDCSDCFRLEQHRRVGFAPTEKRRLNTAHAKRRPKPVLCGGFHYATIFLPAFSILTGPARAAAVPRTTAEYACQVSRGHPGCPSGEPSCSGRACPAQYGLLPAWPVTGSRSARRFRY